MRVALRPSREREVKHESQEGVRDDTHVAFHMFELTAETNLLMSNLSVIECDIEFARHARVPVVTKKRAEGVYLWSGARVKGVEESLQWYGEDSWGDDSWGDKGSLHSVSQSPRRPRRRKSVSWARDQRAALALPF